MPTLANSEDQDDMPYIRAYMVCYDIKGLQRKPGSSQVQFIKTLGQGDQAFIHKVQICKSFYAAKICLLDTPVKTIHE